MRTNQQPQRSSLDPTRRSLESQEFEASLRQKIVGQEEGIRAVVDLYQVFCAQMCAMGGQFRSARLDASCRNLPSPQRNGLSFRSIGSEGTPIGPWRPYRSFNS